MPPRKKKDTVPPGTYKKGKYVPGYGNGSAQLAFVGEAPGIEEEERGIPFVGKAGRKQDELNREAEIVRDNCYWTNIYKHKLPMNDFDLAYAIGLDYNVAVRELFSELRAIPTLNLVVALGDHALQALTGKKGITKFRGSVLPALYGDFKVLGTIHPSHIVRQESPWASEESSSPQMKRYATPEIVVADLIKAKKESLTRELSTPKRNIEIITDPYLLQKFIDSYLFSKEWGVDIELDPPSGIPDMIGLAPVPHHSTVVPLLPIIGKEGELRLPPHVYVALYETLARLFAREDIKFIGHNIKFDFDKLIAVSKLIHPYLFHNKVAADTSLQASVLYSELPRKLEFLTSIFTNEPFYKDEGRLYNPKKDSYKVKMIYNGKDAAVTKEIKVAIDKELKDVRRSTYLPHCKGDDFSLHDFYYNYINKFTGFYMDMEAEGLLVDVERHEQLVLEYSKSKIDIHKQTVDLLGGLDFNPRSHTKDVPHIVFNVLKLPRRKNLRADTMVALLGNHTEPGSKEAKILRGILDERIILTNFEYLQAAWDADGRMRSSWNPGGTETGRSSTSNLSPPLRPFKGKPYQIGLAFQTLPKHGPYSEKIRSVFIAPDGYSILERDYSQAEARVVSLLADDGETLRLFDSTDIHSLTASWIFGGTPESIKASGSEKRFIGKTVRHAGNYGMGKNRLMLDTNADALKFGINVQLNEKEADRILTIFHKKTPKIRSIFQREVRDECQKKRVLWNPFGRMRMFFGYLKDEEIYAQLPQSTIPDQLRFAGLRMWEKHKWLRFIMEMHDAFYWLVPDNRLQEALEITKREMEVEIDFSKCSLPRGKLLIPTEAKVGKRLNELVKVNE